MKRYIVCIILAILGSPSCQPKKDRPDGTKDSTHVVGSLTDSASTTPYKPDPDQRLKEFLDGQYVFVNESKKGYTYFELDLMDGPPVVTGNLNITFFGGKNEKQYTNSKDSATYTLQIIGNDSTVLVVQPEMGDVDWDQMEKRFPGFEKAFSRDASGWPIQSLYKKKKIGSSLNVDFKSRVFGDQYGDSIMYKKVN